MLKLKIPHNLFEQMLRQAEAEAPIEACGILAGEDAQVHKLYKMTNADRSCDHFMMEPEEQFAVVKDIRAEGLEMLAIYHSHPQTPARPSPEDIRLALTPEVVYLILSLQDTNGPDIKGFFINNIEVTEVAIEIVAEEG